MKILWIDLNFNITIIKDLREVVLTSFKITRNDITKLMQLLIQLET